MPNRHGFKSDDGQGELGRRETTTEKIVSMDLGLTARRLASNEATVIGESTTCRRVAMAKELGATTITRGACGGNGVR